MSIGLNPEGRFVIPASNGPTIGQIWQSARDRVQPYIDKVRSAFHRDSPLPYTEKALLGVNTLSAMTDLVEGEYLSTRSVNKSQAYISGSDDRGTRIHVLLDSHHRVLSCIFNDYHQIDMLPYDPTTPLDENALRVGKYVISHTYYRPDKNQGWNEGIQLPINLLRVQEFLEALDTGTSSIPQYSRLRIPHKDLLDDMRSDVEETLSPQARVETHTAHTQARTDTAAAYIAPTPAARRHQTPTAFSQRELASVPTSPPTQVEKDRQPRRQPDVISYHERQNILGLQSLTTGANGRLQYYHGHALYSYESDPRYIKVIIWDRQHRLPWEVKLSRLEAQGDDIQLVRNEHELFNLLEAAYQQNQPLPASMAEPLEKTVLGVLQDHQEDLQRNPKQRLVGTDTEQVLVTTLADFFQRRTDSSISSSWRRATLADMAAHRSSPRHPKPQAI